MKNSHSHKFTLGRAVMVSAIALIGFATTAQAGFEWRGPLEAPRPPAAQPAPAPAGDMMAPVTSWDGSADVVPEWNAEAAVPVAPVPAVPVAEVTAAPAAPASYAPAAQVSTAPSPALAPFVAETPLPAPVDSGDVLSGFGNDLPLVIALQQVVPPGYQYSFAEGVNLGQPVSWQGGKAWQTVLTDMLANEGLGYRVQSNVVVVGYFPPEEAAPETNMMGAPAATSIDWNDAPAAEAPHAGEPVTIRRQRPSAAMKADVAGEANAAAAPEAPAAEAYAAPEAPVAEAYAAPASDIAPVENTAAPVWQTSTDRTAGARAMSYPPEKSSSAPIAVTSEPPAAQNKISAPAYEAPLSAPPPVDMGMMSQDPPADDVSADDASANAAPVDITAADQADADMTAAAVPAEIAAAAPAEIADAAPADIADAPETVAPAPQKTATAAHDGNWNGAKGATLRDTLKNWSDSAGVELYWSIDYDYRLKKKVALDGSYDQAVAALLDQFSDVRPQPYGQLHQGKDGPRVLVVRSYDLTP